MLTDSSREIRDYAREEIEKVREEMQQFARVLDNRFSNMDPGNMPKQGSVSQRQGKTNTIVIEMDLENLRD